MAREAKGDAVERVVILLTDVEPAVRLNAALEGAGVQTTMVSPMDDVRGEIARAAPGVVVFTGALLDPINLASVRDLVWADVAVVGLPDVLDAGLAERLRAVGYAELFPKPIVPDDVAAGVRRLLERHRLAALTGLHGESAAIREVLVKVAQMAPVSSTVLIEGESGTGKELVARAIHRLSPRRAKPFIAVNVGALPESLLESELFGHEKGAFTGAAERRLGRFELADSGTLFLDEIGEIPTSTQVRLLRVLEEREVTRVGGAQSFDIDVRVVAATNRPLRAHVEEGTFRADLYYRLNVLSIYLPPLRERPADIPILVRRFVREFSARHDRPFHGISAEAMATLVGYSWPGNVRELRNLIESMVVLAPGREIETPDIPRTIRDGGSQRLLPVPIGPLVREGARAEGRELEFIVRSLVELKLQVEELRRRIDSGVNATAVVSDHVAEVPRGESAAWGREVPADWHPLPSASGALAAPTDVRPAAAVTVSPGMTMAAVERMMIEAALRETAGNRRRAAELLGIGERTMYRKLREYEADGTLSGLLPVDTSEEGESSDAPDEEQPA